jgi:hypothetical protein
VRAGVFDLRVPAGEPSRNFEWRSFKSRDRDITGRKTATEPCDLSPYAVADLDRDRNEQKAHDENDDERRSNRVGCVAGGLE